MQTFKINFLTFLPIIINGVKKIETKRNACYITAETAKIARLITVSSFPREFLDSYRITSVKTEFQWKEQQMIKERRARVNAFKRAAKKANAKTFNPGTYETIVNKALKQCAANSVTDKKGVLAEIDKQIRLSGYSPAYVSKVMKALCPNHDGDQYEL